MGTTATTAVPVLTYFCREQGGTEPRQSWLHLNFYYWSLGQKTGWCGRAREPSGRADSRSSEAEPRGPLAGADGITDGRLAGGTRNCMWRWPGSFQQQFKSLFKVSDDGNSLVDQCLSIWSSVLSLVKFKFSQRVGAAGTRTVLKVVILYQGVMTPQGFSSGGDTPRALYSRLLGFPGPSSVPENSPKASAAS